jgi:hypothetical protein
VFQDIYLVSGDAEKSRHARDIDLSEQERGKFGRTKAILSVDQTLPSSLSLEEAMH